MPWYVPVLLVGGAIALWKYIQDSRVREAVTAARDRIAQAFGVDPVPPLEFSYDKKLNAAAHGGKIHVNPDWFRVLLDKTCAENGCEHAVAHWLLGHEMTHHVRADQVVSDWVKNHAMELRADFYGGRALALFSDDINAIERVLQRIAPFESGTHPAFQERIAAARAGYDYQVSLRPPPAQTAA